MKRRVLLQLVAPVVVIVAMAATAQPLTFAPASARCDIPEAGVPRPPTGIAPIPDSEPVPGSRDIRRVWLGTPTDRYGHEALGSRIHAASLHALIATPAGDHEISLRLPPDRVFEDRLPRLLDLDGDGRDEIVVVESQAERGAALVVLGVVTSDGPPRLAERARSGHVGRMRWLNPVGAADFDGDGKLELVSVSTPHIGGVLVLHRYAPPRLIALSHEPGVSNHRLGASEQRLAAIMTAPGAAPVVMVPDQSRRQIRLFRWTGEHGWHAVAPAVSLAAEVERIYPAEGGACLALVDGSWIRLPQPPKRRPFSPLS